MGDGLPMKSEAHFFYTPDAPLVYAFAMSAEMDLPPLSKPHVASKGIA